ncbi:uncharacterized protein PFL1_04404 [Pseudozyma flocculosa PF-1]|uniref:Related to ADP1 - ABC transporter n=2 Tax=Pseudozyma flocculosa TaxID=84751 RepID=A0A5C3FD57_9BASI|nr:uncharacterized protein PFL1_04404 [Pseudozyma flocculosa PF-1]EPQ28077.1 hypothetical protein PFL1_04404 [Pseudozyma flocculosa PF-1]SPO42200.1 related to ADP1 - ABC transporter [Pseudozyma flocculosa]
MPSDASALSFYHTCPPGLAPSNTTTKLCDAATCGSIYQPPDGRPRKPSGDAQCACDPGFTGVNCNVCSGAGSCSARRGTASPSSPSGALTLTGDSSVVCYNQPDAVRTTFIDCDVVQPTIQAVFPKPMTMAMTKVGATPDDFAATGVAPWPQMPNTTLASVFYDGVEQFYCQASNCASRNSTQSAALGKSRFGTTSTQCDNLQCYCIPGTVMCGGGALDLTPIINGLSGALGMPCDFIDPKAPEGTTADCAFQGNLLNNLLGDGGLPLKQCRFGSCVTEGQIHAHWRDQALAGGETGNGDRLSGPLIGGLAVLGVFVASLLALVAFGVWRRREAARRPARLDPAPVGLVWKRIDYGLAPRNRLGIRRRGGPVGSSRLVDGSSTKPLRSSGDSRNEKAPISPAYDADHRHQLAHPTLHFDDPEAGHGSDHILHSVSGRVEPGQMLALLGPSGAGKSSLVDILAGRSKSGRVAGEVAFLRAADGAGARPGTGTGNGSTRAIAFVDQDDALPAFSTVREALRMAADLSLPESVSDKSGLVEEVIDLLGLTLVADRRIGDHSRRGVSGGERRRVSIGCALVARPRILVADEPLSGLDSFSASRVVAAFRNLARGAGELGSTSVIMTVHQPSSEIFHTFDVVMLMAAGRVLYTGPPSESLAWCEAQGEPCPTGHNVADHLLKIAFNPEQRTRRVSEPSYQDSRSDPSSSSAPPSSSSSSSSSSPGVAAGAAWAREAGNEPCTTFMTQLSTLSRRAWQTALRDRAGPLAHLVGAVTIGLLVGGCFYQVDLTIAGFQNRVGSMYFLFILLCFAALSASTTLARSRALMVRERSNGLYGAVAWLVSFVLFDAVLLRLIPTLLFTTILYWMVGLKADAVTFFEFVLIAFLLHESVALVDMILSALIEDLSVTILMAGSFILFNIGYGGFLLNLDQIPAVLRWLQWLSPLKYALEAVSVHELKGLDLKDTVAGVGIQTSVSVFAGNLFGFRDGAFYRDLLILALPFNLGVFGLLCLVVWSRMRETR